MFAISSAPAKQSVGETINILSGRLNSATLLEDRRAAILGLRSFAKEYPASVASGALRSLIGSLSKDGEDVDTVKVVLETLLMLFNPNEDSPEASDEIALWLADEFTQRQENVTLLLDFLDTADFYARLYSLQLLTAILAARTERTEECVFTAPLGISRLVAVLDDRREAVRNEAITLLTFLTPTSIDIQKLVAFENAFERVFSIIKLEGSLAEGGRIVEDCLIFLANLLRLNSSNQSTFRETGCVSQLANLLASSYQRDGEEQQVAAWAHEQLNRNIYALLAVVRLFLTPGAVGTPQNQVAFFQHSILDHALQLAFSHRAEMPIRAEALTTCADIIRGNAQIQEGFAQYRVPSVLEDGPLANGHPGTPVEIQLVYVIDGLLDLTLSIPATQAFDLRLAACQCIKSYFAEHNMIRLHFLRRAIDGHTSGVDETANVLTTLLRTDDGSSAVDPYRRWFASVILFHLIYENSEAKALAMAVAEGDEARGEEVVTSIQTITSHLISSLTRGDDERVTIGYLMLLLGWLWEDLDSVNDFLSEGSNVHSLAQAVAHPQSPHGTLVKGLSVLLLSVVYEFSTKDSPISRATLQSVLLSRLGRDKYIDALSKLRGHPALRDFEVIPQKVDLSQGMLPDVFFDATFVDFFKDNYSRLIRAIDREPGMEISVITNGIQKGISRELVDRLRVQLEERDKNLSAAEAEVATLKSQLGQEQADHRRSKESFTLESNRIKNVNEALQRHHDQELKRLQADRKEVEDRHQRQLAALKADAKTAADVLGAEHRNKESELQRQLDYVRKTAEAEAARVQRRAEAEMADLRATISRLEVDLMKSNKARTQDSQAAKEELSSRLAEAAAKTDAVTEQMKGLERKAQIAEDKLKSGLYEAKTKTSAAVEKVERLEKEAAEAATALSQAKSEIEKKVVEKQTTQTELDDLLMVFNDLEEKVEKYKKRLATLGEVVSDAEDDDEEEGEEEDDDDDETADGVD